MVIYLKTLLFFGISWLAFYSKQEFPLFPIKKNFFFISIDSLFPIIIYFAVQIVLDLASGSLCRLAFLSFHGVSSLFEYFLTFWPN